MVYPLVKEVVGSPTGNNWVQVHHFAGLEEKRIKEGGEMVLLLSLQGAGEQTATAFGREIISRVYEEYYVNLPGKPMERLKVMLNKLAKERPLFLTEKVAISLLAAVFWKDYVYLGVRGEGTIILRRKGRVFSLLEGNSLEAKVISGVPQEGDLFVLATKDFWGKISPEVLKKALEEDDLQKSQEILSPLVQSNPQQGKMGAALIMIEKQQEEKKSSSEEDLAKRKFFSFPRFPSREEKVKRERKEFSLSWQGKIPLRVNHWLGVMLVSVLLGSVFWGWQRQKQNLQKRRLAELISQAEERIRAAQQVKSLDINHSLAFIKEANSFLQEAKKIAPEDEKVKLLKKETEKLLLLWGGEEGIAPELFFDLNLLAEGAAGERLVCKEKEVYVFDPHQGKIFVISYPEKQTRVLVGGEDIKDKKFFLPGEKGFYFLDKEGVVFWNKKEKKRVVEKEWGKPVAFARWGRNLYVLDKEEEKLWKMVPVGKGFSSPRQWFSGLPSFSWPEVKGLAINGHVWVLTKKGVFSFWNGKEERRNFDFGGVKEPQLIAVASEASLVVVGDKDNNLFFWDKKGELKARIKVKKTITAMDISPQGKWLFVLDKDKIYWINLEKLFSS
ncbi:hypothetical protein J7J95_01710 [bacterium]|nr:hypothetical protein [bacterium]